MKKSTNIQKQSHFFKTLWRILSYYKGYKLLAILATIFFTITSTGASLYGTYLVGPLINMIEGVINKTVEVSYFIYSVLFVCGLYTFGVISTVLYNQIIIRTSQKVIAKIRSELLAHTLKLPMSIFDTTNHGTIMSYFTNTMDSLNDMLNTGIPNIIATFATIIGTLVGLFFINVYLSFIVVGFMILMSASIAFNMRKSKKLFAIEHKKIADLNGYVEENIAGMKVKISTNHEKIDEKEFEKFNKAVTSAQTKTFYHTQLNTPVIVSLSYFNFAIATILGVIFSFKGWMSGGIGALTSYLLFVRQSTHPFALFTSQVNSIMNAVAGAERIFTFMDLPAEIDEGNIELIRLQDGKLSYKDRYAWKIPMDNGKDKLVPLKGEIKFNNVKFGYNDKITVLKNISLFANEGEKIAFVGSTGAGKTTIASLISRFYEINDGSITYDGINIKDIKKESLRRSMSLVTQETHLFTGTIKENIAYPRRHSSDEEIIEAAKIANAHNFIERLPQGYDTVLYDDGHNLSDGQRQLLALARASISKPPVLILDEATSNIDTRTEQLVQQSMNTLMEDRTVLVIAHNLSTVRNSEAILCLEHGEIIERGSHDDLIKQKGFYYNLCKGTSELD